MTDKPSTAQPAHDTDLRSRVSELVGMVEHLREAMSAITREEDPKAMKSIAAGALAGIKPPPEAKKEK